MPNEFGAMSAMRNARNCSPSLHPSPTGKSNSRDGDDYTCVVRVVLILLILMLCFARESLGQSNATATHAYTVQPGHPRLVIEDVTEMAERSVGLLADDYRVVKERADAAVRRGGIEFINNRWAIPEDLMNCGLAFLVERELGREHRQFADVIIKQWGDGTIISNPEGSHFGYHALAYDWIHDALTPEQRILYGDALGGWLRFYTGTPEILLKNGHWEYNQTWGPIHLNIMNSRDALTQKLFVSLAIHGAGTKYEDDAKAFLDSWAKRAPSECLPCIRSHGRRLV